MKVFIFFLIASIITQNSGNTPQNVLHCTNGCVCSYDPVTAYARCNSCLPGYAGPDGDKFFPCTSKWLITS